MHSRSSRLPISLRARLTSGHKLVAIPERFIFTRPMRIPERLIPSKQSCSVPDRFRSGLHVTRIAQNFRTPWRETLMELGSPERRSCAASKCSPCQMPVQSLCCRRRLPLRLETICSLAVCTFTSPLIRKTNGHASSLSSHFQNWRFFPGGLPAARRPPWKHYSAPTRSDTRGLVSLTLPSPAAAAPAPDPYCKRAWPSITRRTPGKATPAGSCSGIM